MQVPLAWLREYVELPSDARAVAQMLATLGFPVDHIHERPAITGVLSGRIAQLEKHPNADRLQVGRVDVGNGAPLTIATAATNVAAGQTIAVATIGAQLPQMKIEPRKMRGIDSQGMMISAEELALAAEWFEDGILQFDPELEPGTDVVEYFRLSEPVLDVDITANRVDAMSMIGLARELAAYQGLPLRMPPFDYPVTASAASPPRVTLASADARRFIVQRFDDVAVRRSPAWMRIRLALAGQRPINNVVDISNYVMLEVGQPLHFYDAQAIAGNRLVVRDAKDGERLITLDGETHELSAGDLVIADEQRAHGLAGLKGGKESEVGSDTRALLLESATFTGARVRRMSARLGFRTDASSRHEKSPAFELADVGQRRAAHLLTAQGAHAGEPQVFGEATISSPPISFPIGEIRRLLGYELSPAQIREYLDRLGFAVSAQDELTLLVSAPPWRRDVTVSADVVEELARIAGYDRIEGALPSIAPQEIPSGPYDLESSLARNLCALGYREIVTVAMHGTQVFDRLQRAGIQPALAPVEVLNPLSEDQRYLRFALGPGFLQYFARFADAARVFEVGHTFYRDEGQPMEQAMAAFAFTAQRQSEPHWRDSHFLSLKGDAEALMRQLTGRSDFEFVADSRNGAHPGKCASMLLDGREIALLCKVDPRMQAAFDVPLPVYGCWIYLQRLPDYRAPRYVPGAKYPSTYRDLALLCALDVPAGAIEKAIAAAIGELCINVCTFDEYRGPQIPPEKKSLAVRMTLQRADATITDPEADAAVESALLALRKRFDAVLRE